MDPIGHRRAVLQILPPGIGRVRVVRLHVQTRIFETSIGCIPGCLCFWPKQVDTPMTRLKENADREPV